MKKKQIPPVIPVAMQIALEERSNLRKEFMQGVFEEEQVVPLPQESTFEEDPLIMAMYGDELASPGIQIVSAGHLKGQAAANTRLTSLKNILGKKYAYLLNSLPSNTAFELQH